MIRLFVHDSFTAGGAVSLVPTQVNYLRAVMRLKPGDQLVLFNGQEGAWQAQIELLTKKAGTVVLQKQIQPQKASSLAHVTLFFAPLKAHRQALLIEKAVELGVGTLQPVLTQRSQMRNMKRDKVLAQCIEAAEQCERLDVPGLGELQPLFESVQQHQDLPLLWGAERLEASDNSLKNIKSSESIGLLVGPEGGFSPKETQWLQQQSQIKPLSFGPEILRAETAAIFGLSWVKSQLLEGST
ncbi:16S rRNA (uracil(1498)-N(3))-methyltransferase [Alphaproteobacteria bacterium]|nr:16S rRNA (uracil(1498)-N(3))-methyltransferase [Alphaproteobacteria bacterium]